MKATPRLSSLAARLGSMAAALAAGALLVSCWAPYYNPAVSLSVPMYKKLGNPILAIGPISTKNTGGFDTTLPVDFIPSRPNTLPPDPLDGFMVQRVPQTASIKISFVENSGGSYQLAPSSQTVLNQLGDGAIVRAAAANGTEAQLIVIGDRTAARQFSFDPAMHQINVGPTTALGTGTTAVYALGASLLMPPSTDTDSYAVLYTDGTRNTVSMDGIDLNLNSFSDQLNVTAPLALGGHSLATGGRAFLDIQNHRFYYSSPAGPTLLWDTTMWPGTHPGPSVLPISELVTTLLSDGTLVAQGDNYISAYRSDGSKLFTMPAGSVRLVHEIYYPGPNPLAGNYLIFSQVLSTAVQGSGSDREYYVNVWRCPLSDFRAF